MSKDKPVSLAERLHEIAVALRTTNLLRSRQLEALEAEAKALEAERDKAIDSLVQQSGKWGELTRRNTALVEVLRSAPEPPSYGWDTYTINWRRWYTGPRAAVLADEPRKENR